MAWIPVSTTTPCACLVARVQLFVIPWTVAHQSPPFMGFSRQEHWSGVQFPSPMHESEKWKWSCSFVPDSVVPWTAAYQAPPSMGFSRQEHWSGVPFPSPFCHLVLLYTLFMEFFDWLKSVYFYKEKNFGKSKFCLLQKPRILHQFFFFLLNKIIEAQCPYSLCSICACLLSRFSHVQFFSSL